MRSRSLARYYSILDGEETARYLQAKRTPVEVDLGASLDYLWETHDANKAQASSSPGDLNLIDLKAEIARRMLADCAFCERRCGVNRLAGEEGHCGVLEARICSEFLHMGEEPDLVPSYTIFFAGCTFDCVYCQNWDISTQPHGGAQISPAALAEMIDSKYGRGAGEMRANNVNWVGGDPTSNLPYILEALSHCMANLPQVWNSNMYLTEESMRLLDGVVDLYLSDFKYGNDQCALRLSNAPQYMSVITRNHLLGRAHAEIMIRHLVLPGHIECCTRPALTWIAENLDDVIVNVMAQYRPEHRARDAPGMTRRITSAEFDQALKIADELGLETT